MASGSRFRAQRAPAATLAACGALLVIAAGARPALAAPGDLDPSFSQDGKVALHFSAGASDIAVQPDGHILTVGSSKSPFTTAADFAVGRVNPDGAVDQSFGSSGSATTDFDGGYDQASAIGLQADGKIVVAGRSGRDFALARYLSDGTPDDSFSSDGKVTTPFGNGSGLTEVDDLAIQPDGKIITVGLCDDGNQYSDWDFAAARYNADGSLDHSFSGDGKLTIDLGSSAEAASSVAMQSDGGILIGGWTGTSPEELALVRLKVDGALDPSFSEDGIVTAEFADHGDAVRDLVVQADGRILVAGFGELSVPDRVGAQFEFELARFKPDGTLDPTFSGGVVHTDFNGDGNAQGFADGSAQALTLQPDGEIVVAGASFNRFALARYASDGSLDGTFSLDGKVTTTWLTTDVTGYSPYGGPDDAGANAVALEPGGKIVVGGTDYTENASILARYLVDQGPADADADGVLDPQDSCPQRFAPGDGCSHFRRRLTIKFSAKYDEFRGTLTSGQLSCMFGQRVVVYRKRPGPDRRLGSRVTDYSGSWDVSRFNPHGRFYARVSDQLYPDLGVCEGTRSKVLER